jgi:hypothetical protein
MKKKFALLTLILFTTALILSACGSKKTSCAAYDKAEVQTVPVENDLASN